MLIIKLISIFLLIKPTSIVLVCNVLVYEFGIRMLNIFSVFIVKALLNETQSHIVVVGFLSRKKHNNTRFVMTNATPSYLYLLFSVNNANILFSLVECI